MTEWEKAEAGLFYDAYKDPRLAQRREYSQELNYDYNHLRPCQRAERDKLIRENLRLAKMEKEGRVVRSDYLAFLKNTKEKFVDQLEFVDKTTGTSYSFLQFLQYLFNERFKICVCFLLLFYIDFGRILEH